MLQRIVCHGISVCGSFPPTSSLVPRFLNAQNSLLRNTPQIFLAYRRDFKNFKNSTESTVAPLPIRPLSLLLALYEVMYVYVHMYVSHNIYVCLYIYIYIDSFQRKDDNTTLRHDSFKRADDSTASGRSVRVVCQ